MKPEKLFFPLMVFAAVASVYFLFRKNGAPATVVQSGTGQSGVPGYYPESPANFVVPAVQPTPSPFIMLADPLSNNPGQKTPEKPPMYLSFNLGPSHDLTKTPMANTLKDARPKKGSCEGGCGGCGCEASTNTNFPDGRGQTPMASSFGRMVNNTPEVNTWIDVAIQNFAETNIYPVPTPPPTTSTPSPAKPSSVGFAMAPQHAVPPPAFGPGVI